MPSINLRKCRIDRFDAIWENADDGHNPAFCKTKWDFLALQRILSRFVLFVTGSLRSPGDIDLLENNSPAPY
jgi:hypothetical protein